jgi:formylglycine-generating enzyme required for sulfatase activity
MTKSTAAFSRMILRRRIRNSGAGRLLPWLVSLLLCPLLMSAAWSQQPADRVALIIGNATYHDARPQLRGPINDARALAEQLRRLNFDVDLQEDLGKEKMRLAIAAFIGKISNGTTAFFYFSGFGLQSVRQSYLIPVDAQIRTEENVWRDGVSVDELLAEINRKGAKIKIMIIDAARKNPFERRFRATSMGLAPIVAPVGTLALYSAAPGKELDDSSAADSLFATELIKEIRSPNLTAEAAFNRARIGVSRASANKQVPFLASSLTEEFYFAPSRSLVTEPEALKAAPPAREPAQASAPPPPRESSQATSGPGNVFQDCTDCPGLVAMPAGSFEMGSSASDYDKPIHRVSIPKSFAIGRYEVTFKEYDKCVEEKGCKRSPDDRGWGRGMHPVINVSWVDAKEYTTWLSKKTGHVYRLPSEAEWEYAARAGSGASFWWGSGVGSRLANCRECRTGQAEHTMPVGSYKPNAFGLFDTAGNAAEWTEDCWNDDYRGAPTNGSAWTKGNCALRVLRGGSFDSQATYVQSGARFRYDIDVPYSANGFRVVRELP